MANERTLFERILDPERRTPRSARERKEMLSESIVRHLSLLLNSREGCCLTLGDYGMPEIESRWGGVNELGHELEAEIRGVITRYEPGLRRVQVRIDQQDAGALVPKFTISAQLAARDDFAKGVSFTTVLDPGGKVHIDF